MKIEKCPFCGDIPQVVREKSLTSLEFHKDYPNNGKGLYLERDTYFVECIDCALTKRYFTEEEAIAAWNRRTDHIRDTTKMVSNAPLTLDELRQMDGEPVWVMHQDGSGARWGIVKDTEYGLCAVVDDDTAYWFTDVCGTIAYRSKPGEDTNER